MRKLTLLFGAAVLTLTSCSKNDSTNTSVLVKKINSKILTYNGNHIVSIVNSNTTTNYTYTGDLITTISSTYSPSGGGSNTDKHDYTYDSNGKLISEVASGNSFTATFSISNKKEFTYNADGTVTSQNFIYRNGTYKPDGTTKYTFENGNLVKLEVFDTTGASSSVYVNEFDSNNNPLYNITGFPKLLNLESLTNKNNITKSTLTYSSFTDIYTYVYTYNAKGYPMTIVMTEVFDSRNPDVTKTTYTY